MEKSPKKWSLGNILFRKTKKDTPQADFSSDEEDVKAGFGKDFTKKSPSKFKTNKQLVQSFDQQQYSIANPEFHYFKPSQQQQQNLQNQPQQQIYNGNPQQYLRPQVYQNNLEFINNQINMEKNRVAQPQYIYNNNTTYLQYQGSSQDEKSSYNSLSSPINKSGSENGSRTSLTKKSRSARNERYYQRIMRDDGRSVTMYGSVNSMENNSNNSSNNNNNSQKYQMPLSLNGTHNRLSASLQSSSICSSDFMMMNPVTQSHSLPITRFRGNNSNNNDDRDDYENIHEVDESMVPPPIPPRDPNRRFSINSSISQNPYYFDQAIQKYVVFNANGKCFSDDRLWKVDNERPKSARADKLIDTTSAIKQQQQQPHDILRPRSRKPLNVHHTNDVDNECVFSSEDVVDNPHPRQYPISQRSKSAIDFEKMNVDPIKSKYAQRQRNLTSVEPIKYQVLLQQQQEKRNEELQALRKKYSSAEDVNRNKVNMRPKLPTANNYNNAVGTRKSLNEMDLKAKCTSNVSSNLDDAINELELMYKSLVKDEDLMERAARRDLPTPTKFSQLMRKYEEYENEENRNDKEPDILLDDVFSRNLKYANQKHKVQEYQPPFGIPNQRLCPIPPKPAQDYLSVEPIQTRKVTQNNPDLITDDLAVRNLRKDNPNYGRRRNMIEIDNNHFMKRNHTLSSLSDSIYNGILKDSAKPSGGNLLDYLNFDGSTTPTNKSSSCVDNKITKDAKSTLYSNINNENSIQEKRGKERANFEESLNALVIESKAISQKLEKDLSKLKRESVTPKPTTPKTLVNLLDFRKSMEREKEKKSTSCSPIKLATEEQIKPKMTSTACSPITDLDICKEEIIKDQAPKQHKTEKIGNLIKMFNTTMSPEPIRKGLPSKVSFEKPTRKLSDLSNMFEKAPEIDTKPPTQPNINSLNSIKKTSSEEKVTSPQTVKMIQPRCVSPTIMHPSMKITLTSKVTLASPPPIQSKIPELVMMKQESKQPDVESNINNIKELIQQIKLTEFEKNKKPDILKSAQSSDSMLLPDYDNIKDDYEMTDGGKLERIEVDILPSLQSSSSSSLSSTVEREPLKNSIPKESISPEIKSTTSSSLRETSIESEPLNDNSAAIYKDAIEFLQQETAAAVGIENYHKSPVTSIRENKEVVLNYIDKINENLEAVKNGVADEIPKLSVKQSISKLEQKISLSRQNSEVVSEASEYRTPIKHSSPPPIIIKPVVLPKVGPSDTESLYNSSEELAEIFGNVEKQQDVPMHPGKIIEEDFEAEFEKIALEDEIIDDKLLDENFNVTLIDINNNSDFADCFDNELSDLTNESAMSTSSSVASKSHDDNNNNLTNELSKLTASSLLMHKKPNSNPSTSNCSNSNKISCLKSSSNSSSTSKADNTSIQQQPLKTQCILLACLYCVMLYMQFIIYNFKSNN